jgi:uncharacterized membrane protein YfcA
MPAPLDYAGRKSATPDEIRTLNLIALLHMLVGGLGTIGIAILIITNVAHPANGSKEAIKIMSVGLLGTVPVFYSGYCIKKHRKRAVSLTVSALICLFFPVGTIVGAWTIYYLSRRQIVVLYKAAILGE